MDASTAQCSALLAYSLKPFGHSLNFAKRPRLEPLRSQGMPLPVSNEVLCYVLCGPGQSRHGLCNLLPTNKIIRKTFANDH